jgi:hypothetical protein
MKITAGVRSLTAKESIPPVQRQDNIAVTGTAIETLVNLEALAIFC